MIRYTVTVTPHSSLFIGGYAASRGTSNGDTASDVRGMLIPGSALKGALREAAVRLIQGAGRGQEVLKRLFGDAETEGVLRVGPLRPEESPDLSVRHHVSLERATRQAAPGRLFQNRVTAAGYGLSFRGELTAARELSEDEQGLLESARQITDQLGGGRGRGLGLITLEIESPPAPFSQGGEKIPPVPLSQRGEEDSSLAPQAPERRGGHPPSFEKGGAGGRISLALEAEEPLQLGIVKDLSNVSASKGHLDGSAVRGAVAAALSRLGHEEALDLVLGGDSPAQFGDGHPGHVSSIPAPLTLREPKAGGAPIDDAVRLCAGAAGGQTFRRVHDRRAAKGSFAIGCETCRCWYKVPIERRMVTRTARNLVDGRAADGLLFSLEVIEPKELRFFVPVTGSSEQLDWVVQAASAGLTVGGTRSRGFGLLRLSGILTEPVLASLDERHRHWIERVGMLGVKGAERTGALLAVGPLAVDQARLQSAFDTHGLELIHGVSRSQTHGGWNSRAHLPRGIGSCFVAGSTFIVVHRNGDSALDALKALETEGIGPGRPDGWGRLIACHPIHVDCFEQDAQENAKENEG